jgi:CubicO group peptidase (beta-lactamase class C family)
MTDRDSLASRQEVPLDGIEAYPTHDELNETSPASVGLDQAVLDSLGRQVRSSRSTNVHSILVMRHGALALEWYFGGEDERWGEPLGRVDFNRTKFHDLRSATKSLSGLLVGIAIDQGIIQSIDQPIMRYFPEYADLRSSNKDRILLSHLLTMSGGLEWDQYRPAADPRNNEVRMLGAADPYRYALDRSMVSPPGKKWVYSSGATELLGAIVSKAADRSIDDFAREFLFGPLGIGAIEWIRFSPRNVPSAASGLRLRPRDIAKLGQLVLGRGRWGNHQIVSEAWIEASTSPQIGGPEIYFYGYHWMLGRSLMGRRDVSWISASGQGGQRIFIVPTLDLVVVITAGLYASAMQYQLPLEILNQHILAAVKD